MRVSDILNTLVCNDQRGGDQEAYHQKGDEGFCLSMAVRVIFIGGATGIFEAHQDQDGRKQIRGGFYRIRDQRVGMTKVAGGPLDDGQQGITSHAIPGRPDGFLIVVHAG